MAYLIDRAIQGAEKLKTVNTFKVVNVKKWCRILLFVSYIDTTTVPIQ